MNIYGSGSVLVKNICILDPNSSFNQQICNLFVSETNCLQLFETENALPEANLIIDGNGCFASPNFTDSLTELTDPGNEHRDTLNTLAESAIRGGYGQVIFAPNSLPAIDNASILNAVQARGKHLPIKAYFLGAASEKSEGKQLSALGEMHLNHALGFTDYPQAVQDIGLIYRLIKYLQPFNASFIQLPIDMQLAPHGVANDSAGTAGLGLKTSPPLAEELMISKCLQLLAYAGGKIHFCPVTTTAGVQQIRNAKAAGLKVSCSTAPQYLFFIDEDLAQFETNLKVFPPFRSRIDASALVDGLADGTIDFLTSLHCPLTLEDKEVEFDFAQNGILSLETAFASACTTLMGIQNWQLEKVISLFCSKPNQYWGLPQPKIESYTSAELVIINPNRIHTIEHSSFASSCKNSPYLGRQLTGAVLANFTPKGRWINPALF